MERLLVASTETSTKSFGRYKQLLLLYVTELSIKSNTWYLITVKEDELAVIYLFYLYLIEDHMIQKILFIILVSHLFPLSTLLRGLQYVDNGILS